jgi:hypothetical protein
MRIGRGRWRWYNLIILGLSAAIVYPDKVLGWIEDRTGRAFGWRHIILLEVISVGLLILVMTLLISVYPRLDWWYPVLFVGLLAVVRVMMWLALQFFGFDD